MRGRIESGLINTKLLKFDSMLIYDNWFSKFRVEIVLD